MYYCIFIGKIQLGILNTSKNIISRVEMVVVDVLSLQYSVVGLANNCETRLHSSRMRTGRLLPVSPSMHCAEGVCSRGGGGACLWSLRGGYPSMQWDRPPLCEQNHRHV